MLHRLWLTDAQTKTLVRALRNQVIFLNKCAYELGANGYHDKEENCINEVNAIDDILDIIDTED